MASDCPNEGICHTCGKVGHRSRECLAPELPPGDLRLCNNCYKQGHIAVDCTNEKACNNCRKTGHLARDCPNEPICNLCNISGHVARECPKAEVLAERGGGGRRGSGAGYRDGGYRDIVCRTCNQVGHISRDCMGPITICHNCGGRGHFAYECPSGRFVGRGPRRYWYGKLAGGLESHIGTVSLSRYIPFSNLDHIWYRQLVGVVHFSGISMVSRMDGLLVRGRF